MRNALVFDYTRFICWVFLVYHHVAFCVGSLRLLTWIVSLKEFTNYNIGLATIFEGEQMMSNMLPVHYAPKYFDDRVSWRWLLSAMGSLFFHGFPEEEGILCCRSLFILTGISCSKTIRNQIS